MAEGDGSDALLQAQDPAMQEQAYRALEEFEDKFYLEDGRVVSSIAQLKAALATMDEYVFYHHVTPTRNDFAAWIRDVIGDVDLAWRLQKTDTMMQFRNALETRYPDVMIAKARRAGAAGAASAVDAAYAASSGDRARDQLRRQHDDFYAKARASKSRPSWIPDEEDDKDVIVQEMAESRSAQALDAGAGIRAGLAAQDSSSRVQDAALGDGRDERSQFPFAKEKHGVFSSFSLARLFGKSGSSGKAKGKGVRGREEREEREERVERERVPRSLPATASSLPAQVAASAFQSAQPSPVAQPFTSVSVSAPAQGVVPAAEQNVKIMVPGFSDLVAEGIPQGSAVLLSGGPGTGKTTFALCALGWACRAGQRCLYLSFEEEADRLRSHMRNWGFEVERFEAEGLLIIRKMDSFDLSRSAEALLAKASGELLIELEEIEGVIPSGFSPDLIVVDSLSAVSAAFWGRQESYRIYLEELFALFKKAKATSFFISEVEHSTSKYSRSGIEEFLADAVIAFYNLRHKTVRIAAIEVIKVRGVPHAKKIVPFKLVRGKGMVVYPQEDILATL